MDEKPAYFTQNTPGNSKKALLFWEKRLRELFSLLFLIEKSDFPQLSFCCIISPTADIPLFFLPGLYFIPRQITPFHLSILSNWKASTRYTGNKSLRARTTVRIRGKYRGFYPTDWQRFTCNHKNSQKPFLFWKILINKFHWVVSLYQGQYRIILSADTASEVRQMPSQKRR